MLTQKVTLGPHPSKGVAGLPLFPMLRSIFIEGVCVGYTGDPPFHRPSFIHHEAGTNPEVVAEAKRLIKEEFGVDVDRVSVVPPKSEPDETEYEEYGEDA